MTIENEDLNTDGLWCIVANIKRDHPFGPVGVESKSGTRQFRGGTKVYIAGCYHGMCESVVAIGLHRHTRKFITCVVDVQNVEGFRAKVAYHPKVVELIKADDRCWIRTNGQAEMWAAEFPEWQRLDGRKLTATTKSLTEPSDIDRLITASQTYFQGDACSILCDRCQQHIEFQKVGDAAWEHHCSCGKFNGTMRGV